METIKIKEFEEEFVIYFGGEPTQINAYTLASSLVSIADAVKAANNIINPGYDVEVIVDAFGPGSFKVRVKTLYEGLHNLFKKDNLKAISLSVIAAYVYQHTLAPESEIIVNVNDKEVVIETGDKTVIVPREVHNCVKEVEKSEKFKQSVSRTFEAAEKDKNIKSLGFTPHMEDEKPLINIPREKFSLLSSEAIIEENTRVITEIAKLEILRAILQRSKRKWEFVWRGIKIPAPVLDQAFYDDFFAHKVTIAPGDSLEAQIRIHQVKDPDTGIYTNDKYEVLEVIRLIPRLKQTTIET